MKRIVAVLILGVLPSIVLADFSIQFENTGDETMVYSLFWIDHPFKSLRPANMAAGELDARKTRHLNNRYASGKYFVIWKDKDSWLHEMYMDVNADITHIIVAPGKWESLSKEL